jgi:hypothetical protein
MSHSLARRSLLPLLLLACRAVPARAEDAAGTAAEAQAMAVRAADLLRSKGAEVAFPELEKGAAFHDRDLYVMVYDATGRCVAHGANPALVGKMLIDLKDTEGKYLVRELVAVQGSAWVDYRWPNPVSKKIETKHTWVVSVGDYRVGVGIYQ